MLKELRECKCSSPQCIRRGTCPTRNLQMSCRKIHHIWGTEDTFATSSEFNKYSYINFKEAQLIKMAYRIKGSKFCFCTSAFNFLECTASPISRIVDSFRTLVCDCRRSSFFDNSTPVTFYECFNYLYSIYWQSTQMSNDPQLISIYVTKWFTTKPNLTLSLNPYICR